jgi:tRNA U38,U39,U40 pseudouridine synthase TruA
MITDFIDRAPRRFHALFSATWRRYVYIFPLNKGDYEYDVDVDIPFIQKCFKKIEGVPLHYNGFAFREDRGTADSVSDECTLYKINASLVNLNDPCVESKNTDKYEDVSAVSQVDLCSLDKYILTYM